ncbi:MAG: DUF192 domain-containing protein [Acetobacter sp.]|nr:DUF192 domain-containing protein [Acetobacter sp.]
MRYLWIFLLFLNSFSVQAAEVNISDKAIFNVPIAKTVDELQRGLMFVRELPEDGGMLFDFRSFQDRELSMWMKNTYIPLDMFFISCGMMVVDIRKNTKPMSLELIRSNARFCYVLEAKGGIADAKNIHIGDKVIYSDTK